MEETAWCLWNVRMNIIRLSTFYMSIYNDGVRRCSKYFSDSRSRLKIINKKTWVTTVTTKPFVDLLETTFINAVFTVAYGSREKVKLTHISMLLHLHICHFHVKTEWVIRKHSISNWNTNFCDIQAGEIVWVIKRLFLFFFPIYFLCFL